MPFEIVCSECKDSFLVEETGVVVECPSCSAHIEIPTDLTPTTPTNEIEHGEFVFTTPPQDGSSTADSSLDFTTLDASQAVASSEQEDFAVILAGPESENPAESNAAESLNFEATTIPDSQIESHDSTIFTIAEATPPSTAAAGSSVFSIDSVPPESTSQLSTPLPLNPAGQDNLNFDGNFLAETTPAPQPWQPAFTLEEQSPVQPHVTPNASVSSPLPAFGNFSEPTNQHSSPTQQSSNDVTPPISFGETTPLAAPPAGKPSPEFNASDYTDYATNRVPGVSRQAFTMLMGYASASTIALGFFIYQYYNVPYHQLESLPDIKPPTSGIKLTIINPDNSLPRLHVLNLGQSRRFGNIEFTPIKITRGPVTVAERDEDGPTRKSDPVLKLHVRFRNVSENQSIIPLDRDLLYARTRGFRGRSNQWIKQQNLTARDAGVISMFEITPDTTENILGQTLDQTIAPGETFETFLPSSEDGVDDLTGPRVWRMQFRKGQNPESGNPVTTLVDILFDDSAIQADELNSNESPKTATLDYVADVAATKTSLR